MKESYPTNVVSPTPVTSKRTNYSVTMGNFQTAVFPPLGQILGVWSMNVPSSFSGHSGPGPLRAVLTVQS